MDELQGDNNFFAIFNSLYLVSSDILLTHTHTHTGATGVTSYKNFLAYARVRRGAPSLGKGHTCGFFAWIFVFLAKAYHLR